MITQQTGPGWAAACVDGVAYVLRALAIAAAFVLAALAQSGALATDALAETAPGHGAKLATQLATVTPNDMTSGGLLLPTEQPGAYVQAPLVATDIALDITGIIARSTVTQRFVNPSDGWVEGMYVFPLPDDAAVDGLRMQIGERFIEGHVMEKQAARTTYEQAKAAGTKATLIEQNRPNIFTNSIANIGPGDTITVQITYQQTVRVDNGVYGVRAPLVVAPRFTPPPPLPLLTVGHLLGFAPGTGGNGDDSRAAPNLAAPHPAAPHPAISGDKISPPVLNPKTDGKTNPVKIRVSLDAGFALGDITSHHHPVQISRDDTTATLSLDVPRGQVPADKDFEVTWTPRPGTRPNATLFLETRTEADGARAPYALMMLTPPADAAPPDAGPRDVVFVIDTSGSMAGPSIEQAKASLFIALKRLRSDDRFNVIRFDTEFAQLFPHAMPAEKQHLDTARAFVSGLTAEGGTHMLAPLRAALRDTAPADTQRLRQVVFLTDGAVDNEAELFTTIAGDIGDTRLFTVGIGSTPNTFFMRQAAEMGRGSFTHIGSARQIAPRMAQLIEKLETSMVVALEPTWPRGLLAQAWPNPLPDLYAGEPVVMTAKLARRPAPGESIEVSGVLAGKPWRVRLPLAQAQPGTGIANLWARRKIAALEAYQYAYNHRTDIDARILEVALDHQLVSRLTSLVAVDITPSRPADAALTSQELPLNLPEGWDFDKVFGPDLSAASLPITAAAAPAWQVVDARPIPLAGGQQPVGIVLPAGSTPAPLLLLISFGALGLGMLLLLLYRRDQPAAAGGGRA